MPSTFFNVAPGLHKEVAYLGLGDKVIDGKECEVEVVHFEAHPSQKRTIVELRTRAASLKITGDHRIPMANGTVRLAREVRVDDQVLCGNRETPVTKVLTHIESTHVFEVGFKPDNPVECSVILGWNIATKGISEDCTDMISLPDTVDSYR